MTAAPEPDHLIGGTPFFIRRSRGHDVMEAGAGRRGTARRRATCQTFAEATALAASMAPSTPAEILAECPYRPWGYDKLVTLGQPGTRLWVLPGDQPGYGFAAVSDGLAADPVEALFGSAADCWLVRWHADDGTPGMGLNVTSFQDAARAWWIVRDGRIIAGGPPIYDQARAREIAAGLGGDVVPGAVITKARRR